MVSNVRDRNIDSSRREDSRKGQVDRCEVINVRPHVAPYPEDKDFNTVDVQLIDRPRINGKPLHIKYVKLNSLQREHGRFQGNPWNARIGDMIYVYWLAEREALVLGTCTSVEQEPVCRSQADAHHQEYVFKLSPWEEPKTNQDGNYVEFPNPKHPDCYKWWPKTRDSIWIFDCLEGHNCASCDAQAPCNGLDDHLNSTCFKHFSDISPTTVDEPWRFKFLHHCGSFWWFDEDAQWRIEGNNGGTLGWIHHYSDGKIKIHSPTEIELEAPKITLNAALTEETGNNLVDGSCTHNACSCPCGGGCGGEPNATQLSLDQIISLAKESIKQDATTSACSSAVKNTCTSGGQVVTCGGSICCSGAGSAGQAIDSLCTSQGEIICSGGSVCNGGTPNGITGMEPNASDLAALDAMMTCCSGEPVTSGEDWLTCT